MLSDTQDVSRITDSLTFPYLCIQLTIGYVLGLLVMAREFGRTTTIAVLILILANTIGMPLLAKRQISSQALWSKASDARVKLISSVSNYLILLNHQLMFARSSPACPLSPYQIGARAETHP